jgi:hypothetical protein
MSSISAKVLGTWKKAKSIFVKSAGTWKQGRKAYVKVNNAWKLFYQQIVIPPIRIVALGHDQNQFAGNTEGVYILNVRKAGAQRSFNLATFTNTGGLIDVQTFDLNTGNSISNQNNATRMITNINNMVAGQIFSLYSYDDPSINHDQFGLPAVVAAIGGTDYGNTMFFRSAYVLIGKVGQPAIFESSKGNNFNTVGDPNAWLNISFSVVNGFPVNAQELPGG